MDGLYCILKLFHELKFRSVFCLFLCTISIAQAQNTMKLPEYLKKGDTVAIVATARKYTLENLEPSINLLKKWGLEVVVGKTIGLENNQLGGTDLERAADFQSMVDNANIKAIWCVRGGYGTVKMIDLVDFTKFKKNPKWVVGFSDCTVLHNHIHNMGVASLHAIMPINVTSCTPEASESLRAGLFGEKLYYEYPTNPLNRKGDASGVLVGGNLSVIYSLLGSKSAIDTRGKILFIEDLDEYLYHIDRMMMNLKRNGYFDGLKGLIVGGMSDMHDNEIPWGKNALEIIREIANEYDFPISFDFPAGHIHDNKTLILGKKVILKVHENGSSLEFE
ncbi:S66 peptidase family protein [Flavobacterium sp. '19STA2R22 D10 B1']|uniref:S66 peptidase family protein n=1 Tax=Flavobacterium aerium TaxID=3037261 RepID=UPI00278C24AD|nr:LD-carboxypeptidase [Flavobacterium sp. '19STA2R22 D10 B1']